MASGNPLRYSWGMPIDPAETCRDVAARVATDARERGVLVSVDVVRVLPRAFLAGEDLAARLEARLRAVLAGLGPGARVRLIADGVHSEGLEVSVRFRVLCEDVGGEVRVDDEVVVGRIAARPAARETRAIPHGLRLLVVEDDAVSGAVLRGALEPAGIDVTVAMSGGAALEAVERLHPHLVLMDVLLPDLEGTEVTRRLREGGSLVPVVGVTSNAFHADLGSCLDAGMNDVLTKPVPRQRLLKAVARWSVCPGT